MTSIAASASFGSWEEEPGFGPDAPLPRISHASVAFAYDGELTGTGACQYVLSYRADGAGTGVGFEALSAKIGDEPGEVVLRHEVAFTPEGVTCDFAIVEGSGTGAFVGTTGSGSYTVGHGGSSWDWALDLERS